MRQNVTSLVTSLLCFFSLVLNSGIPLVWADNEPVSEATQPQPSIPAVVSVPEESTGSRDVGVIHQEGFTPSQLLNGNSEQVNSTVLSEPTPEATQQDVEEVLAEIEIPDLGPSSTGSTGESTADGDGTQPADGRTELNTALNAAQDVNPGSIRIERVYFDHVSPINQGRLSRPLNFSLTAISDTTQTTRFTATSWAVREAGFIERRWIMNSDGTERRLPDSRTEIRYVVLRTSSGQEVISLYHLRGGLWSISPHNTRITPAMRTGGYDLELIIGTSRYDASRGLLADYTNGTLRIRRRRPDNTVTGNSLIP